MMEHASDISGQESTSHFKYPPVTYLTMAYEPINTMHAIISAIEQDYPGEKTIVLIHQESTKKVSSALINIENIYTKGKWPSLWLTKLEAFVMVVNFRNVVVWWDEDDRFEVAYSRKAVEPIINRGAIGTWTDKTYYVKRGEIIEGKYPRSNGTLVIKADALKATVPQIRKIHPSGQRVIRGMDVTVDPTLIKILAERYKMQMMDHGGMRYYFMRSGGNGGPRRKGKGINIDE